MQVIICPKCKREIASDSVRCPECGMRINTVCRDCGTLNRFGVRTCKSCGRILIKYCPECNASNTPEASRCRRCGVALPDELTLSVKRKRKIKEIPKDAPQIITPDIPEQTSASQTVASQPRNTIEESAVAVPEPQAAMPEITEQTGDIPDNSAPVPSDTNIIVFEDAQVALNTVYEAILPESPASVIALCGEEGSGKSTIIKSAASALIQNGKLFLTTDCSELTKIAAFGAFREILLDMLGFPRCHPSPADYYSDVTKQLFVSNFGDLSDADIDLYMNFLFPKNTESFEYIRSNKIKTFELLEKILKSVISKHEAVLFIDNFDLIDAGSFAFINHLINKKFINNNFKLIITYRERKSAENYFEYINSGLPIYKTFCIANMTEEQTKALIKRFANSEKIPTAVEFAVLEKGKGNPFFTEQFLSLLFDAGYMFITEGAMNFKENEPIPFLPQNIEEVIQLRLGTLTVPELKQGLYAAAVLGCKFDKALWTALLDITDEQAETILRKLCELMFLVKFSDLTYEFKNMTMWSVVFEEVRKLPDFKIICKKAYYILGKFALSVPALKATCAKNREDGESAYKAWSETADTAAALGDDVLFASAAEEALLATGYKKGQDTLTERQVLLKEQIGKVTYLTDPESAGEHLTDVAVFAKESGDSAKVLELCGYLIKSCYKMSDFNGVIESVNVALDAAEEAQMTPGDIALIKSRKTEALFKTGNCEEGINLINNDILPILEEMLSKPNDKDIDSVSIVFNTWFNTSRNLINLYALQGNVKAISTADAAEEVMQMNNIVNPEFKLKINLSRAFALAVIGKIEECRNILAETEKMPAFRNAEFVAERNLISAFTKVLCNETDNLKTILFEYSKFADNLGDEYGKHIFKLMLGWLLFKEEQYTKANLIFNDELTYFAKSKIVTGALISWYFIATIALTSEGAGNAEQIAMKALEVAQNPKFSQYHAAVYLQKLIAEINLMKGDGDACKMYLEKAMLTSKQFGLELPQIELYRTYAQFLGSTMGLQGANKAEIADKALKIYQAAIVAVNRAKVPGLLDAVKSELNLLVQYCNSNNIPLNLTIK